MTGSFDPCGPLPRGVTVLEASAGTGKTYTIAALAARYVAEGIELDQLLLVTFTRLATGELRERVRERLSAVEHGLSEPETSSDEIVKLLSRGNVDLYRARIARALESFDAATIATIHEFCGEMLGGLGISGDVEHDYTFLEDPRDLVEEVVDDLYAQRFALHPDPPVFDRREAGVIADIAIRNPIAPIEPDGSGKNDAAATRARFARAVREQFEARKRRLSLMTYDDLLTRLRDALSGPGGAEVAARLRQRYRVVLVDEFQDTDPVQWEIMERAFGGDAEAGNRALVLIGDPKQAIYSFRGADVYAYLRASHAASSRATLQVNWRSDQNLIDAYDALFDGAALGHPGIVYRRVKAHHPCVRLRGAPAPEALRIRVADRQALGFRLTQGGCANLEDARTHVAADVARDIVRLLHSRARLAEGGEIEPGHIAVLVRRNAFAELVQHELREAGVPAVINGACSVFATPAADQWLRLLEALERPATQARVRSAALTGFLGWNAEQIARADDAAWEDVYRRLHEWARVLRVSGVASLVETITLGEGLPERILSRVDGERQLTDLRHVGELLHAAASKERLGVTALTAWLRRRVKEARREAFSEERSRRLESDAQAVQVLTIHRSKGLEFPVVYCPDLWDPSPTTKQGLPVDFHDPRAGDERRIDVGLRGTTYQEHWQQHVAETRGEDLRLAYVALTRAQHQAVLWWAGTWGSRNSSLGRLLFARAGDGAVLASGSDTPTDSAARARLGEVAKQAPGCVSVEESRLDGVSHWSPPLAGVTQLQAASWERELDWRWRRTSYSDISAGAHDARVTSEPEAGAVLDEPDGPAPVTMSPASDGCEALLTVPSLLEDMPMGVHIGTLVHRVFETADFAAEDLDLELGSRVREALAWQPVDVDPAILVRGLRATIETRLGGLVGRRLRDVHRADRLDELSFELPLAGGDSPDGVVKLSAMAKALRMHLPADDLLAGYADRLSDPGLRHAVRGYLSGSIDLVMRVDGDRFFIVDYKTNWLGVQDQSLTAWHHRPAALSAEMQQRHYFLQALLYTVALHRYLHWRLPGYDAERNFGGVLYLFVRGMTGAETPEVNGTPCGVFAWKPPAALVQALSEVLDGHE
ncbi:MAG: UvrD-helicase domain-containing protein [Actinomycetota bacterium]|nr:UvrD-helicase domain-containing protein [Actinomycetota bacterium]